MSYLELVPLGLYEPPWRYPLKTLANDLGYHLSFGTGTALAYAALRAHEPGGLLRAAG